MNVSTAIQKTARKAFEPFQSYLRNVIDTMEKKEAVNAKWKKVDIQNPAELRIIGGLYEIPKQTAITVEKGWYRIASKIDEPDFEEKLIYRSGEAKEKVPISKEDYEKRLIRLDKEITDLNSVSWAGEKIQLEPAWMNFQKGDILTNNEKQEYTIIFIDSDELRLEGIVSSGDTLFLGDEEIRCTIKPNRQPPLAGILIREENNRSIVYAEKKPQDREPEIKEIKKIESFIDWDAICFENGEKAKFERNGGLNLILQDAADYGKTVVSNKLRFKLKNNNKEAFRIQLTEMDDNRHDDEMQTISPLRHFFEDEVSVKDNKNNEYTICDGREAENTLVLRRKSKKGEKKGESCLPDGDILRVEVNTYQLKKQLEAVSTLMKMPVGDQRKLIRLFENRNDQNVKWEKPREEHISKWYVITDETRSGYYEQRQFVEYALNTPDFALLEGPPGSGKTTVILELVCQLAKLRKRVLLCGSTHVAVDNILERLKEKPSQNGRSLLDRLCILPVRIGDENRINEDVREFQIDNLKNDADIKEELLLDAANLVCGTTIGILQHPRFIKRNNSDYLINGKKIKNSWIEPIVPEFDYLIIDESSKTTFQEFLVPALYAKKWILAGDVMQLSPFTERENIVSNLKNLLIDGKPLERDVQDAVFYLCKLKECVRGHNRNNHFVIPVAEGVITAMLFELANGRIDGFQDKIVVFITDIPLESTAHNIIIRTPESSNYLELAVADIIAVDKNRLPGMRNRLPERHALLLWEKWQESEHAFIHNAYQKIYPLHYEERGKEFSDSFEIAEYLNEDFKDKNWAEEVAWRIEREHELRLKEKSKIKENYTRVIEELIPKSLDREKIEDAINGIAVMAFPSILESLVQGIKGSRKQKVDTAISEGFKESDLKNRKTTLVYQHRMHPDISQFPRERFYKERNALLDVENPSIEKARYWEYSRYSSRTAWIDVPEGKTVRNYNEAEVNALIKHLKDFLEFAKTHEQPEGKEWTVACLTFYRGQEAHIREKLQALSKNEHGVSNFNIKDGKYKINIKLHTVDKFQGHEADIVFLSMVQTKRVGFMDNPNRLNVALTRAKFQLVIIGKHDYFAEQGDSDDLQALATKKEQL
ncbi:MAG: AAA family ATPase [Treponema sp.]|nr:AAA family ATPase [Treponema sp.]